MQHQSNQYQPPTTPMHLKQCNRSHTNKIPPQSCGNFNHDDVISKKYEEEQST